MADDIVTDCEGVGFGHRDGVAVMCAMCGRWFVGHVAPPHERLDILAMIKRGDFDD